MIKTDVLIIGGGLAGLSTAYHLDRLGGRRRPRYLIAEGEDAPGGRAGSVVRDGFTFDHTGHLFHLHDPYGKRLILSLLRGNVALLDRSSWIRSNGAFTRYPFQANTYGLPERVKAECVASFMRNVHRPVPMRRDPSFEDWCLSTFGEGIYRHFMRPYNRKLWRRPLSRLTTEWLGRFVPRPSPEEVLYGALTDQKKFFGYNACFRYPVRGGAQALADALAGKVRDLRLSRKVERVHLADKVAEVAGLGEVRYERLVNTAPLVDLLSMADPLPRPVRAAQSKLRYISVHNLNIGVNRPRISDKHWIYFPENRYVFYRAGFCSNFSPHLAPRGTSSMYIEVARRPEEKVSRASLERRCLDGLRACGILKPSDKLAARVWIPIPCAYVVFDRDRPGALRTIFRHLESKGVESIGRWGGWKYSFMEETVLDGKRCAERLLGRRTRETSSKGPLKALR